MTDWFDELDLDPAGTWRKMGTRALGERPWLVTDDKRTAELELRSTLLDERRDEVLASPPEAPAHEVVDLLRASGVELRDDAAPLAAAGRSVQEDLCLLQRRHGAWHLDAACLCFPSRWRLGDKIGRPLIEVHGPTPGYGTHLAARVDRLLDRLGDRPILRRNWFVHPDPSLFQPEAPADEPLVPADEVRSGLHLRSERQTLRALPSGWILFTIRIQHDPLGVVLDRSARLERFENYVRKAPSADLAHRGISPEQARALRVGLGTD